MNWALFAAAVMGTGVVAWHWGRAAAPSDLHALKVLLGEEMPLDEFSTVENQQRVTALQDRLIEAGWVHSRHLRDPERYDESGCYWDEP